MPLFYYRTAEQWYQIEADGFRPGDRFGWYQNLTWTSGLFEQVPQGDTNPESRYYTDGRCGSNEDGILYHNQFGFTSCGRDGRAPRERIGSISWFYVRCSVEFVKNGAIIKTVLGDNGCPEVRPDIREPGCEECCSELLSAMRSLHI